MEINEIVSAIESLTLIQASELVKALEEKFGVSAAAPVAAAGVAGAPAAAAEEKTEFDVVLAGFDAAKKVAIIKAVREVVPGLGLKGSQGHRRRRSEDPEGRRFQGRGRGHEEEARRSGREGRNQVISLSRKFSPLPLAGVFLWNNRAKKIAQRT